MEGVVQMRENETRGNTKKIYKKHAMLNTRRYIFSNRVVNSWNGSPDWVVNGNNVISFEK